MKKKQSSGFTELATAVGGSIGTANIAGVASAIAIGGPGAILWMWLSGLIGMGIKYAEVYLACRFRTRDAEGKRAGGTMYCISLAMGKRWRPLARAFSVFGMLAALSGGAIVQVNTMAAAAAAFTGTLVPGLPAFLPKLITGAAAAACTACVILGGKDRIGRAASLLVPFMSALYVAAALVVIVENRAALPGAFSDIWRGALGLRQAAGGAAGFTLAKAAKTGFLRGMFSHEAGAGSSPMAYAAGESDPRASGRLGVIEVLVDTMLICTLTALMVLCSGAPIPYGDPSADGMAISLCALAGSFGAVGAGAFLFISVLLFAFTSMLAWSLYGDISAVFLFGPRARRLFCAAFICCCVPAGIMDIGLVWRAGELMNLLMAVPNLIMMVKMGPKYLSFSGERKSAGRKTLRA